MSEYIKLSYGDKVYELPLIEGTECEKAIDIKRLRYETGLITLDTGYSNTGSCTSSITFVDGEKGVLRYRGVPIEQLAEHATFKETAYLLINGKLPNRAELTRFSERLNDHCLVREDMKAFCQNFPRGSHPMRILSAIVTTLNCFYPELQSPEEEAEITVTRLLAKFRTMAAMSYKISRDQALVYPRTDLTYTKNFLNMMFDTREKPYEIDLDIVEALKIFWILHADHEQNCSTSTVRIVGSSRSSLNAAISSGIAALWGSLHGGANQAVIEMLIDIMGDGKNVEQNLKQIIKRAKDKSDPLRLMGFGHRVYKTYDPRAIIMKRLCDKLLRKLRLDDPLLDLAKKLETIALNDNYFIDHNLYPNVDFYSGIVLRTIGIPTNMFTVLFAIGRLPGWIAQWKESMNDPKWKLCRPRQIYTGPTKKDFQPIDERDLPA